MTFLVKQELKISLEMWKEKYVKTGKEMNVVSEITDIYTEVILACAFGEDISQDKIMIETHGQVEYLPMA